MPGRLGKLEGAISKQRTINFPYYSISRNRQSERTLNPYGLLSDNGSWYVDRPGPRSQGHPHVPRLAHPRRHPLRNAPRTRLPHPRRVRRRRLPRPAAVADRRPRRRGAHRARAATPRGGSSARTATRAARGRRLRHGVLDSRRSSRPGSSARTAAPSRSSPTSCAARSPGRCAPVARAHEGAPPKLAADRRRRPGGRAGRASRRPGRAGAVRSAAGAARLPPRRLRRGAQRRGHSARTSSSSASTFPEDELEEHLQLLNLVNFGGGCYTVYAALEGDQVHVDKELYGDTFRLAAAPDTARGAGDPPGARVRRPDDRRRRAHAARPRAQEARGDVRPVRALADARAAASRTPRRTSSRRSPRESASGASSRSSTRRRASKRGRSGSSSRTRSSASCRTGASTRGTARATPSAASGSTACAVRRSRPRQFEPRAGFRAARLPRRAHGEGALSARASPASWAVERGATPLKDGTALAEMPVGSPEWLIGEILVAARRGRPARARRDAQRRSRRERRELANELGVVAPPRARLAPRRPAAPALKTDPRSSAESTSSDPPCASAIERAMKRPRPVPGFALPPSFERPNFSKISCWSSVGMPGPWSTTSIADAAVHRLRAARVTSPPAGEYLTALSIRFCSTWRSRSRSPRTSGSGRLTCVRHARPRPGRARRPRDVAQELRDVDVAEVKLNVPASIRDVSSTSSIRFASRDVSSPIKREERLTLLRRRAPATDPAVSARRRSRPPSGCEARATQARRSRRAEPRAAAARPQYCAPPRTRECSARRWRRAARAARRARPPPAMNASRSARTSPSMPIVRGPTCSGASTRLCRPRREQALLLRIARRLHARAGRRASRRAPPRAPSPAPACVEPGGKTVSVPRPATAITSAPAAFHEHDRDAVERDEPAQFPDERGERLVGLERGARERGRSGSPLRAGRRAARAASRSCSASAARAPPSAPPPRDPSDEPADDERAR